MATPYQNTISGLLRKRTELTRRAAEGGPAAHVTADRGPHHSAWANDPQDRREAGAIKERLSIIGSDVQALDRTLGLQGKA